MTDKAFLSRAIDQGRGAAPADLVIKNVGLLDLVSGGVTVTDIAICGDRIVGTYATYKGIREIDASGLFGVPGFIDTHLHIESSLLTPQEFDRCVLPHGVTTAICDPHEIANVLGLEGIRYFLDSAETRSWTFASSSRPACRPPRSRRPARGFRRAISCRSARTRR